MALLLLINPSSSKHIRGTWKTNALQSFIAKFAFDASNSQNVGYVYGNVTADDGDITKSLTLVFINETFEEDFRDGTSCSGMFSNIGNDAFDERCSLNGTVDLFRVIPCPEDGLCGNKYGDVIPQYQFTFKVESISKQM